MIRKVTRVLLPLYAVILVVGGVIGYRNQGSQESLIAGSASGALSLLAALLAGRYPRAAHGLATVVALVLTGVMGYRWEKTGYVMPAGLIATLSGGMATLTTSAIFKE